MALAESMSEVVNCAYCLAKHPEYGDLFDEAWAVFGEAVAKMNQVLLGSSKHRTLGLQIPTSVASARSWSTPWRWSNW